MKLYYANKERKYASFGNFGDDLNGWLWPRLLPRMFSDNVADDVAFVGFGTILNDRIPRFRKTAVFSTGHGFFAPPKINDSWKMYCVRGPLTCHALGLAPSLGVTDGAALVREVFEYRKETRSGVGFIPYAFEMQTSEEAIRQVTHKLGLKMIDPRRDVEIVMKEVASCECLISAAMHGAIVADAFRVPWKAVLTNKGIPLFKWRDWLASVELEYTPKRIIRLSRLSRWSRHCRPIESMLLWQGLRSVLRLGGWNLSAANVLDDRVDRLLSLVEEFRDDTKNGMWQ